MFKVFQRIKLISHNASHFKIEDDPSFPFKMEATLAPPDFLLMQFLLTVGPTEDIVLRGKSVGVLNRFIRQRELRTHPRLIRLVITGPKGVIEEFPKKSQGVCHAASQNN